MTTPERLKHRQRFIEFLLGVLLVVMGAAMVGQSMYYNGRLAAQDKSQRECLAQNFSDLTEALEARAQAAERESASQARIWNAYIEAAGLLSDDPTAELPPEEQARFRTELVQALIAYGETVDAITAERKDNPIPAFPSGTCDSGSKTEKDGALEQDFILRSFTPKPVREFVGKPLPQDPILRCLLGVCRPF